MTATGRPRAGGDAAAWLGPEALELSAGWEIARADPAQFEEPSPLDGLEWLPALVPGTAAAALRSAGRWRPGDDIDFDASDWWFRIRFDAEPPATGERLVLVLDGIATVARVFLNGELLLDSDSMFLAHAVDIGDRVRASSNELTIRCAALGPLLAVPRRPRARWRTRLVSERNLRFFRTMLLGRAPGFAPRPAVVGPWKPIRLERHRGFEMSDLRVRPSVHGREGRLSIRAVLVATGPGARAGDTAPSVDRATVELELGGEGRGYACALQVAEAAGATVVSGELAIPDVQRWWPHTHGAPVLYEARLGLELAGGRASLPLGRVGFRSLEAVGELERDGLRLQVNGVSVFARGAVWTPPDALMPGSSASDLRPVLEAVVAAGMNMVRVPGIACYEADAFYDACDELGILVWQDFMFANLDYPDQDAEFAARVRAEAGQLAARIGGRPCLAVMCGGSEVAQQAAMMGLDPAVAGGALYEDLLPAALTEAQVAVPYVPSTPWGGDLPFRPDRGVANYYGVGAYLRPLEDARHAEVKFAAECLAFSNVPDEDAFPAEPGGIVVHHPVWKAGVPRDVGAGWDFEDVRDHYLRLLFDLDPVALRSIDHARYLELSRQVTGEVMAEVYGEWRRAGSPCAGALILWLKDLRPGAGWGLLDHRGAAKVAYHHVRRALAPVAVWSTDEGLGGVVAHLANDRDEPVAARLRVAMYRDLETRVEEVETDVVLGPHSVRAENVEALLGRFVDASWAYRFGPPAQNLIALSLEQTNSGSADSLISQTFRFPAGRPSVRESAEQLGLQVTVGEIGASESVLRLSTRRFAYGVRLRIPGFVPEDDAFSIEPGRSREVRLRRTEGDSRGPGLVTALNLSDRVRVEVDPG